MFKGGKKRNSFPPHSFCKEKNNTKTIFFWWGQSIFLGFLLFTGCLEPSPCRRLLKINSIIVFLCRILDGSIGCFYSAGMVVVKKHTTNLKLAESVKTV
jgi:hypothetical protein